MEKDRREILSRLTAVKAMALATKATVNWTTYWDDIEQYLDDEGPANWRAIFRPLIAALMLDQGKRLAATFGFRWDVQNLYGRDWFNSYMLKFATDIFDTTKTQLRSLLNQGMAQGWSIEKMANNMGQLFDAWVNSKTVLPPEAREWFVDRLPQYRLEAIARTETIRASNYGSMELYREWGIKRHEWISTQDDRTRRFDNGDDFDHMAMNQKTTDIGTPFIVPGVDGDEALMYPGDPEGSAANTINCRCTTVPVIEDVNAT
jgi:hypothetical protein